MTDEEDASLLRTRSDVPPEMHRALRALQAEGPSRSSLDQVAARLGALLDAAPPAPPSAASWLLRTVGIRAVALRVGMAVLALGATAVWLRPGVDPARLPAGVESQGDPSTTGDSFGREPSVASSGQQAGARAAEQASELRLRAGEARASAAAGAARPSPSAPDGETGLSLRDGTGNRAHRTRARPMRVRSSGAASLSEQAGLARAGSTARRTDLDKNGALAAEQRAETSADKPDAAVPPAAEPAPEPPSVRKLSEVELLLEARRLSVQDPKAAQRLLEQHAVRFPDGVLAPEREVLAIEVLKAQGQTAAAERRLRAFRARYPNSMHLRRLSSPPATQNH